MQSPNDVIQKIEKTLCNTLAATQMGTNNGFRKKHTTLYLNVDNLTYIILELYVIFMSSFIVDLTMVSRYSL